MAHITGKEVNNHMEWTRRQSRTAAYDTEFELRVREDCRLVLSHRADHGTGNQAPYRIAVIHDGHILVHRNCREKTLSAAMDRAPNIAAQSLSRYSQDLQNLTQELVNRLSPSHRPRWTGHRADRRTGTPAYMSQLTDRARIRIKPAAASPENRSFSVRAEYECVTSVKPMTKELTVCNYSLTAEDPTEAKTAAIRCLISRVKTHRTLIRNIRGAICRTAGIKRSGKN